MPYKTRSSKQQLAVFVRPYSCRKLLVFGQTFHIVVNLVAQFETANVLSPLERTAVRVTYYMEGFSSITTKRLLVSSLRPLSWPPVERRKAGVGENQNALGARLAQYSATRAIG
jgi:hypothetical protein